MYDPRIGDYEDYIAHHGIMGMKWGVRKSQSALYKMKTNYKNFNKKRHAKKKAKEQGVSFTEGGKKKADTVMSEKTRKRALKKINEASVKREKDWDKLYKKRSQMGDREIQLALNRLRLENNLAQEVQKAKDLTKVVKKEPAFKRVLDTTVKVSAVGEIVYNMIPKENKPEGSLIRSLGEGAKAVNQLNKAVKPKDDKKKK